MDLQRDVERRRNNLEVNTQDLTKYSQSVESDDAKQHESLSKRKTSASVDEIRDLYSALQELVPSQGRPPSTTAYTAIPEEAGSSRAGRATLSVESRINCDVMPSSSNPSPAPLFSTRHRCSSPLPRRSQPKIVQRNRSNSCFTLSASSNSLMPESRDSLRVVDERGRTCSPTDSKKISEELTNLIENFDKGRTSPIQDKKYCLRVDSPEIEEVSTQRRLSGGDILEKRRERLKDPQTRRRRKSIGGSLLLSAIVNSTSTNPKRQDSLANALSLIARKDELQEILKNCQGKSEQENKDNGGSGESFDEIDGKQQEPTNLGVPEAERLRLSLLSEQQKDVSSNEQENLSSDLKIQASVGNEMHNLLEALQELVVSGEGTLTPPGSCDNSRRTSWVERTSPPGRKESLQELEAFFKNSLPEISERENDETLPSSPQQTTKAFKNKNKETVNFRGGADRNRFRRSSSAEQYTSGTINKARFSSVNDIPIHRSQSFAELLNPNCTSKASLPRARRAGTNIEENRRITRRRSNSTYEIVSHLDTSAYEKKLTSRSATSSQRSRRRKSDVPILRHEDALDTKVEDEAHSRALWKEDQEMFAKQVNQRLQDWLEKATALSLRKADKQNTEGDSTSQVSIDTNPESSREEVVKTKRSKFAMKKVFNGRVKRSKSLHSLLDPEEIQTEKPKSKSPLNLLKLGRLRIPRAKSMHNDALKPKFDNVDTKSTESDESLIDSPLTNVRRTIWYDNESDSPEIIPKCEAINVSGENPNAEKLCQRRRRSCPTPKENNTNMGSLCSKSPIDSNRISRLPVGLPLFYVPEMDASNPRITGENWHQNSNEKETKMPRVRRGLFPVKKEIKNELFYKESKLATQLYANPLTPPTVYPLKNTSTSEPGSSTTMDGDDQFTVCQNHDRLSVSPELERFCDFRDRAKSTESEDSGCPNTSDYC